MPTPTVMAKAKAVFNYSLDGITSAKVKPGGEPFEVSAEHAAGLVAAGLIELEGDAGEVVAQALENSSVTRLDAGGTSTTPTELSQEHRDIVAAAPENPPDPDDRKTPVHGLGSVVDPDDRAAREAAQLTVQSGQPLAGNPAAEAQEVASATGEPVKVAGQEAPVPPQQEGVRQAVEAPAEQGKGGKTPAKR